MSWKYYHAVGTTLRYWSYTPFGLWLTEALRATSIWIIVSFTVERYIAVYHPLKRQIYCTEKRAKKAIIFAFMSCFSITGIFSFKWRGAIKPIPEYPINETDNQITQTVIGVSIVYTLFQLPTNLLAVFTLAYNPTSGSADERILLELRNIFNLLGRFNPIFNFLIYMALNKDYRKYIYAMFLRQEVRNLNINNTPRNTRVRYSVGSRLSGPARANVELCNVQERRY
ncbi:unnamed protein product [Orchesella dallaii]|uniref:G-protein coupled receptors family 1 profile domain-containing protein n=1 Tax=Orchesella dallaii TaxID=48710 RepID=A0ABP1S781_9HEXA